MAERQTCPVCGHVVRVVGETTLCYEPVEISWETLAATEGERDEALEQVESLRRQLAEIQAELIMLRGANRAVPDETAKCECAALIDDQAAVGRLEQALATERAEAQLGRTLLREAEWSGWWGHNPRGSCPVCGAKHADGHTADCRLRAALAHRRREGRREECIAIRQNEISQYG